MTDETLDIFGNKLSLGDHIVVAYIRHGGVADLWVTKVDWLNNKTITYIDHRDKKCYIHPNRVLKIGDGK